MKREFIVAVRSDRGQLLVLETYSSLPVFPGGMMEDGDQVLKVVSSRVTKSTGLHISGLHLASVGKTKTLEVHRLTAFVAGGQLLVFPIAAEATSPVEGFRSASWIAPSLFSKLSGVSDDMKALIEDLGWMHVRDTRVTTGRPTR